jgi:hypothetical protein
LHPNDVYWRDDLPAAIGRTARAVSLIAGKIAANLRAL